MTARLVAVAALATAAAVLLPLIGGGDDGTPARPAGSAIGWQGKPLSIDVPALPRDHIVTGRLVNRSLRAAELDVEQVRLFDPRGRALRSTARFSAQFAHGLYPPDSSENGGKTSDFERRRLGEIATLRPGQTIPVTLSWRVPAGAAPPVTVDLGPATLRLP